MRVYLVLILLSLYTIEAQTNILINEIVSSNSIYEDVDGDTPDWIELYNPTDNIINISGFAISDDIVELRKWIFPDVNIAPGEYLIVFASDKDKITTELHTNFKISVDGVEIILTNSLNQIIDQLEPTPIPADISRGRSNSDNTEWLFYPSPTPGEENNTEGFVGFSEDPIFSQMGGFYTSNVSLELSTLSNNAKIYFTTDGSEPTLSSIEYTAPISINNTTVIRARAFNANLLPSKIFTNTYFINENTTLPVVSLSTNPDNFWDDYIGIYVEGKNGILGDCSEFPANWHRDWERPVHIELFENDGSLAFSIDAGVGIHGGCTRNLPQKSLKINARGKYGSKTIPYKIFPNLPFEEYVSILLRSSGNDNHSTLIRDPLMHGLIENLDLEIQAYRPVAVFLNGEYFGIHNMRERIHKDYIFQHTELENENIDLLKHSYQILEGDNQHYLEMYNYIQNNNLSVNANYSYIQTQMEIDSYITYMLSQMYFVNRSWYPGNTKFWRSQTPAGKWRWILYDTDNGFGLYGAERVDRNMIAWVTDQTKFPSVIINGLLENEDFSNKFINTAADLANTVFTSDIIIARIDSYKTAIQNEVPAHIQKWGEIPSYSNWETKIDVLKYFANNRLPYFKQHFINYFDLEGIANVDVDINFSSSGSVQLNTIKLDTFPWSGEYFQGVPITIEAIPNPGYRFVSWSGDFISTDRIVTYTPSTSNNITAEFELDNQTYPVVINEISYNSPNVSGDDPDRPDWIELYNNSDNPVDLSSWQFNDVGHTFVIPNETEIEGRGYLILAQNLVDFQFYYPSVANVLNASLDFGLSSKGEKITLYSLSGSLVDTVEYNQKAPWPIEPDGNGPTLELVHPDLDNNFSDSWRSSNNDVYGTPGEINDSFRDIYEPFEPPKIVINEINYNSPDVGVGELERPDWIELYNNSDDPVDLSGWQFKDEENTFIIPDGTTINGSGYLVLVDTISNFQVHYPSVSNLLTEGFLFGLSGGGELLRLFNQAEILIDQVEYDDEHPWPIEPDNNGPTLELVHPDSNNVLAENWRASLNNYGTPGQANSVLKKILLININVLLEGAYISSNLMSNSSSQVAGFPFNQPFTTYPWNYQGDEIVTELPNNEITDWVLVELREEPAPASIVARRAALLKSNGKIVDLDGESNLAFYNVNNGDYFIIIHHRNHLSVMSKEKIPFN